MLTTHFDLLRVFRQISSSNQKQYNPVRDELRNLESRTIGIVLHISHQYFMTNGRLKVNYWILFIAIFHKSLAIGFNENLWEISSIFPFPISANSSILSSHPKWYWASIITITAFPHKNHPYDPSAYDTAIKWATYCHSVFSIQQSTKECECSFNPKIKSLHKELLPSNKCLPHSKRELNPLLNDSTMRPFSSPINK